MREARTAIPRTIAALPAILITLLVASCATYQVRDELPPDAEKGWVVFVVDAGPPLSLSQVSGASAGESFPDRDGAGKLVASACPPGRNDFLVRDRDFETRVTVPVAEGMVTHVGVRRQVTSDDPTGTWYTRISIGTHPLPFAADASDPAPFVTALVDQDWGTRRAAVEGLRRIGPPLEPSATPLLTALAGDDPQAEVREAARSLLASLGKPVPAPALLFVSFAVSADGWPLGGGLASSVALVAEGYRLEGQDPRGTAWRSRDAGDAISSREDLDVMLECRWMGGSGAAGYGLTLGSGPATFLAFSVDRDGGTLVTRFTDGKRVATPLPRNPSAAPAITGTPVTRIEVTKRGARYQVAVNGEAVGGFTDSTGLEIARLGVLVDGEQSVVFRKIVVTSP